MNTPLLRPIYVFGTGLLLCTSIGVFSQAAAKGVSIATDGPVLLAPASGQSSNPFPPEVLEWQRQVKTLHQQGKYQEAVRIQEKELAWTEKHLGPDHLTTASSLYTLGFLYLAQGSYAKAEPVLQSALAIREKIKGPEHPDTAQSLNSLSELYYTQGAYAKSESLVQRSLAIREKALGPHHPITAESLNNLGAVYLSQGAYPKAESLVQRSLAIREKALGPNHPDTAESLSNLGVLYFSKGAYAKAEQLYLRSLAIRKKALGHDHPDTATSLNNLALLYDSQGAYAKAEPLFRRALAIREKALGPDHANTAVSLNNLAGLYSKQGEYAKAEPLYRRALTINEKALGPDHPTTATNLNNLAGTYRRQGAYAEAELLYLRVLVIIEKALGPDHRTTAVSLNNLAGLYSNQGAYAKAAALYLRALTLNEKALGPDHPDTAASLNNLAVNYQYQGAYVKAEPLHLRALAIREQVLRPDHSTTAESLNNLAVNYQYQGAYVKAEPLYLRALAITEKALGPDHPETAKSINNLAGLYLSQGSYAKAEPLLIRALALRYKVVGLDHIDTANSLNNLAGLYLSQGSYAKAEPFYSRALAITEKALGPDHPTTATSLTNLAHTYQNQGTYAKAEPLYLRALKINEKALGLDHLATATSLSGLAAMYYSQRAYAKAEPLLRRGIGIESYFLQGQLPLLPQNARLAQVQALDDGWEVAFSGAERSGSAADLALFSRMNRYGLLLEIEQRQAQLGRAPGAPQVLTKQITALTARLSDAATTAAQRQELGKRKEELERAFYRLLPSLKPQLVEPAQVARVLPAGAVLVEFQRYRPFDGRQKPGKQWGAPHYVALVLNAAGTTQAVVLGPAPRINGIDGIDPLIAKALAVSQASGGDPTVLWKQVNSKVFPARLLQLLAGANQWILAPDGELSRIPFAALPSPRDPQRRLTDDVAVRLISSGRTLLPQIQANANTSTRPLVVANPDFGEGWPRLPATADEGQMISKLLKVELIEKAAATTTVLTRAKGPRLVHIASHGYFSGAAEVAPQAAQPAAGGSPSAIAGLPSSREDAMLNSGIVLAGANRSLRPDRAPGTASAGSNNAADDGYLTAKEAAQLQLTGTELVVLSACDTASGEQQSGEGLFGLQRALSVAGARTTLLSLWKVDDAATAYFMQRYYNLLQQGKGRMEALLAVQQEFRSDPPRKEWSDYRFWAAWQLTGDSTPLPSK
jgi:tetratricopeptide (TPR) repeat protein/CHAT domain-containing protein